LTTYLTPTTTAEYTYNTKGLRISKTVNGQETRHIWDGSNIVMELNGSDQVIDKYIRGYQLIKSDLNGYYLYNTHGDVIQLTDQQGTVTTSYLYDAFGIEQEPQPNDPNPFRYCGEYLDKESGNVYLRARYYDPETGRFISEDPIRDGLNWYVYASNNPVNRSDPLGLEDVELREYSENNDATVTWTGNTTKNGVVYANATVTYNGTTKQFEGKLVNNKLIIDDSVLNSSFGWRTTTASGSVSDYFISSGKQIILGNYSGDVTALGTSGQILLGLAGADLPCDIRDLTYDISNWEWSWSHAGDTALDAVGLLPVIGTLKYVDEGSTLIRKLPANARFIKDEDEVFKRLEKYHGIDSNTASKRLHDIKRSTGRGGADNVVFDLTGNVYDPNTGELLGTLTGGAK